MEQVHETTKGYNRIPLYSIGTPGARNINLTAFGRDPAAVCGIPQNAVGPSHDFTRETSGKPQEARGKLLILLLHLMPRRPVRGFLQLQLVVPPREPVGSPREAPTGSRCSSESPWEPFGSAMGTHDNRQEPDATSARSWVGSDNIPRILTALFRDPIKPPAASR